MRGKLGHGKALVAGRHAAGSGAAGECVDLVDSCVILTGPAAASLCARLVIR